MSKPFPRFTIVFTLMIALALALAALPAFAGGWAVVTLDRLPEQVIAGEPITVGFVVRQHGVAPLGGLSPSVTLQKEGEPVPAWITARPEGEEGHYAATLTFPSAGVWNWSIQSDFWPENQPMPALTVLTEGGKPIDNTAAPSPWPLVVGSLGLVGVAGGGLALVRTRAPWAAAITLVSALVGVAGFAWATTRATALVPVEAVSPLSQAELGQRLFVAKGCVVCHTHDSVGEVKQVIGFNMDDAPDLTDYSAKSDYLAKWLDDPKGIKPNAYMPRLNLSDDEIGALVIFINTP